MQGWNAPDLARRMKVEAHCRERKKFSTRRGRTTLTEPLQSHFLCLEKTFPAIFLRFCSATLLLRFRRRDPTFLLKWKHQHHGAALPRNGHHHTSSSRSEPPARWQSPAELVDHRGEVSTPVFLFQRRPERYSAVYEEDGRYLDVGGISKHRVLTSLIISVLDFKASWFVSLPPYWALLAIYEQQISLGSHFRLIIPLVTQIWRFL